MTDSRGSQMSKKWETFWFEDVPPDLYALLRIVFGFLGLICVLELTPVSMFWAIDGIAPIPGSGLGIRSFLMDHGLGGVAGWAYFLGSVLMFSLMTVGFMTRFVVWCSFIAAAFLWSWNHLPLSSAYQVLVSLLFCLVWADCSGEPSIDALVRRRRGLEPVANAQPIWPLRLMRFQVCLIYFNSGISKFAYPVWRDGAAVHYSVDLNIFHRLPWPLPPSIDWVTTLATYVTLLWEITFPLMMFNRITKRIALAVGIALHLGMWSTLELGPFSFVMIGSYLAFLDPVKFSQRYSIRFRALRASSPTAMQT
jgi:hypothetical protein